jgi:stearoyl-CoA desaturase (delta-9 desaturase)
MAQSHSSAQAPPERGHVRLRNLSWPVIIALGGVHVIAAFAVVPSLFTWSGLAIMLGLIWVTGGLGIALGYHRLLTHRSFRTPKWFEYVLTTCGCLAWQGGPLNWVGIHRLHHKHADDDHDPHSPRHGFTWSHILWMLQRQLEGIRGKDAAKDLQRDPPMRWLDRLFWVPQLTLTAALFFAGWAIAGPRLGASWVVWGIGVRTVIVFHATWFVNSASHTWGYQNYTETGDDSTNLWWVALLSFGEGWHNNHHRHPRSAAHGLRRFELDPTWWTIKALARLGLAHDIHSVPPDKRPDAH